MAKNKADAAKETPASMSKTSIPYEPLGPKREQRIGKLLVNGNDSWATVGITSGLVPVALEDFDNSTTTDTGEPSAFNRAVKWAETNQNDPRIASNSLFM